MKNNITQEEFFEEIEVETSRVDSKTIREIINEEKKIQSKSSKLDAGKFRKLIMQIRLALSLIKDFRNKSYTEVPWRTIAMISAAILYFINPFDMVPDVLPLLGITDDAILFATVFKSIQADLEKYGQWKGIKTADYF